MNNKKVKIAINGFGRIGRMFFKLALKNTEVEIVAINDLGDIENMAYLLKYDSSQKDFKMEIKAENNFLIINEQKIPFYSISSPLDLPWKKLEVDIVVECTGVFNSYHKSNDHLKAGAKRVVLSGPTKDVQNFEFSDGKIGNTVLMGVNEQELKKSQITSNGSCTTNAVTLPLKILNEAIGIENAMMSTIHSYTISQPIVDGPVKKNQDFRRGRAGAQNILPTSTGSAEAVPQVYPELAGKFEAIAVRVPTICGSLVDLTCILKKESNLNQINNLFQEAEKKYQGILKTTVEPIVSSDIIGDTSAGIIDLNFTKVSGKMVKILVWYDNESGYAQMLLKHILKIKENLK